MRFDLSRIDDQAVKRWLNSPYFKGIFKIFSLLCMTMVAAKALTAFAMVQLATFAIPPQRTVQVGDVFAQVERFNYRNLRKAILDRNLFNSGGEYPDEAEEDAKSASGEGFDIKGPCRDSTLNITLVGTIFTGNEKTTLVTIQEKGVESPDIYKVGDQIVGAEQATVAKIERKKVIINNGGVKECMELADPKIVMQFVRDDQLPSLDEIPVPDQLKGPGVLDSKPNAGLSDSGTVSLNCNYVEGELGADFGKIMSSVRIVPNPTSTGGINGFKVFSIPSGSLLDKVGLKNGDVIQQVNDTNLSQPDQGFALFQALQDEESLRISVLRQGDTPITLNVSINCK